MVRLLIEDGFVNRSFNDMYCAHSRLHTLQPHIQSVLTNISAYLNSTNATRPINGTHLVKALPFIVKIGLGRAYVDELVQESGVMRTLCSMPDTATRRKLGIPWTSRVIGTDDVDVSFLIQEMVRGVSMVADVWNPYQVVTKTHMLERTYLCTHSNSTYDMHPWSLVSSLLQWEDFVQTHKIVFGEFNLMYSSMTSTAWIANPKSISFYNGVPTSVMIRYESNRATERTCRGYRSLRDRVGLLTHATIVALTSMKRFDLIQEGQCSAARCAIGCAWTHLPSHIDETFQHYNYYTRGISSSYQFGFNEESSPIDADLPLHDQCKLCAESVESSSCKVNGGSQFFALEAQLKCTTQLQQIHSFRNHTDPVCEQLSKECIDIESCRIQYHHWLQSRIDLTNLYAVLGADDLRTEQSDRIQSVC